MTEFIVFGIALLMIGSAIKGLPGAVKSCKALWADGHRILVVTQAAFWPLALTVLYLAVNQSACAGPPS